MEENKFPKSKSVPKPKMHATICIINHFHFFELGKFQCAMELANETSAACESRHKVLLRCVSVHTVVAIPQKCTSYTMSNHVLYSNSVSILPHKYVHYVSDRVRDRQRGRERRRKKNESYGSMSLQMKYIYCSCIKFRVKCDRNR